MIRRLLAAMAAVAALASVAPEANAKTTIKMATLAPRDSTWGHDFVRWKKEVSEATNGELEIDWQWNGQAGDEALMVQKIRSRQLDGAAITAVGLGRIFKDVLIFQLPGLFPNWRTLDAARNAVKDELNAEFDKAGFTIVGWGDVGAAKAMSIGYEVRVPSDVAGKGTFILPDDPIEPRIFALIPPPGVHPTKMGVNEILPALTSGAVTFFTAPPLVATQLQWASRVTHMNNMTVAYGIGAVVVSSEKLKSLSPEHRDTFMRLGHESADRLTDQIRRKDGEAWVQMKGQKTTLDPSPEDVAKWRAIFDQVRAEVRGSVFSPHWMDIITAAAK